MRGVIITVAVVSVGCVAGNGCVSRLRERRKFMEDKKYVRGFEDLDVYQNAYKAMLMVYKQVISSLPKEENYDLKDQLRRSSKAVPRLIAEGHAKRHQKKGFQRYIDEALAESNETMVSLCQVRDLYPGCVSIGVCKNLVNAYDKISRQLYNLSLAWERFAGRNRTTRLAELKARQATDVSRDATTIQ